MRNGQIDLCEYLNMDESIGLGSLLVACGVAIVWHIHLQEVPRIYRPRSLGTHSCCRNYLGW